MELILVIHVVVDLICMQLIYSQTLKDDHVDDHGLIREKGEELIHEWLN